MCVWRGEGISYASVKQTASTAGILNCSDKNTDPPPQIRAHFYSITLPQPQLVQMCFSSCSCLLCSASEMDEDVYECPITNSLKITFQVTEMCLKTVFCPGCLGAAPLSCVFPFQKMFSDVLPNTLWHSWSDYLLERNQIHIGLVGRQNLFSLSDDFGFASHILS